MYRLFADTTNWDHVATKNWQVEGGPTAGLGLVYGVEAKILIFTHGDLNKKKGFLLLSQSIGAKWEAKTPNGLLEMILTKGGMLKKGADGIGYNPTNFSPPANVDVDKAFSVDVLNGAVGCAYSGGSSIGIIENGFSIATFYSARGKGRHLFRMDEVTLQGTIGIGVNASSFSESILLDLNKQSMATEKATGLQDFNRSQTGTRSPYWRGPGGGI